MVLYISKELGWEDIKLTAHFSDQYRPIWHEMCGVWTGPNICTSTKALQRPSRASIDRQRVA